MNKKNKPRKAFVKIVDSFESLINELGIKPGDEITISTPKFHRDYEIEIKWTPETKEEFDEVKKMPSNILKKMGLAMWDKKGNFVHWLYPGEWFNLIPDGYEVVDIFNKKFLFKKNTADDDIRFGCLLFGFTRLEHKKK